MMTKKRFRDSVAPFTPGRGRAVSVRSKMSGKEGLAYPDDPHVWVEGLGVAGWYRRETLDRDFIKESD
jgi:hypothetical protein